MDENTIDSALQAIQQKIDAMRELHKRKAREQGIDQEDEEEVDEDEMDEEEVDE